MSDEMSRVSMTAEMKQPLGTTSLFYTGCDEKEALYSFLEAIDFSAVYKGNNRFEIKDYKIETIDIPTYFDYQYVSGQTLGESTEEGGGGSGVNIKESTTNNFTKMLKKFLSPQGKIQISERGYVTIMDHPQRVLEVKKIIQKEIAKQSPIDLSVSLVRVSMTDDVKTAANFNVKIKNLLGDLNGEPAQIGTGDYTTSMTNGFAIQGTKGGLPQVFKALQTLGETKIIREYNVKTRSGILSTFRAVDKIPYVTTSSVASVSSTSVNSEAKFATAGIIVNVIPQLTENKETVNLSTDILVSEYLGDKTFATANGDIVLPMLSENEMQVPAKIKMGESVILTGFNLRESESTKDGIPGLVGADYYGLNRLFGGVSDSTKASQIVIIITPKRIKDF
jgi:type II secretory pathway component GspD/PulD (secretin)